MRIRRWKVIAVVLLAVTAVAGCALRKTLILHAPGLIARLRNPIADNRPIPWERGPETAPKGERPPNVVVILADDLGFNDVTFHGGVAGGRVPTPHIDSIARDGVAFTNGYAGNAVCAPSRAMVMTGRYSTRFGFEFTPAPRGMARVIGLFYEDQPEWRRPIIDWEKATQVPSFADLGLPPSEITMAEVLKAAGLHTIHIGKWHLGSTPEMRPNAQGFDETVFMESGLYLPVDSDDVVNSKQEFDPIDQFLWPNMRYATSYNGGELFEPAGYLTDYYTDEAVAAIEANRNRPFLLFLAHWAPHTPLQALRSDYEALADIEDHRLRVYAAMIRALDRSVGRVLAALEENGLAENTLVVFTSDNGGAGYIGLPEINRPYRGWKLTLFEGGTHVPFFMRWPGRIEPGTSFDAPVSHLDIFTTAAAAAGATLPDDRVLDGVDLVPYVRGDRAGRPHDVIFWRQGYYQVVLADGWKLQVSQRPNRTWLFHLDEDPTEQQDLSAERPDKVAELRALLAEHNAAQAEPAWPSFAELPVAIDKTLAEPAEPDDEIIYFPN